MKIKNLKKNTKTLEYLYDKKDFAKLNIKRDFKFKCKFDIKKDAPSGQKHLYIKGYASTDDQDRVDDIITLEALTKSKSDLLQPGSRTAFYNHNRNMPIGKVMATSIDEKGLIVEVKISNADDVKDIRTKIKEGILNSFSIGGRFKKVQVERDDKGNISSFKVLELELMEVSVVGIPCNPKASIFAVLEKSFKGLETSSKKEKVMIKKNKKTTTKKNLKAKKTQETPVVKKTKVLSKKFIAKMIRKANAPILESLANVSATMAKMAESFKTKTVATKKKLKKVKKAKKSFEQLAMSKINDALAGISKKFENAGKRKGAAITQEMDEDDEVETKKSSRPEKCLDINDPNSMTYVKWLMGNGKDNKGNVKAYGKLSEEEKMNANAIYVKLMAKAMRR